MSENTAVYDFVFVDFTPLNFKYLRGGLARRESESFPVGPCFGKFLGPGRTREFISLRIN